MLDRKNNLLVVLIIAYVAILGVYIFNPYRTVSYFLYLLFPLFTFVAAVKAFRAYGIKTIFGKPLLVIAIGTSCILLGETGSAIAKYILFIDDFPAYYDVFYSIGVLCLFAGTVYLIVSTKTKISIFYQILIYILFILASVLIAIFIYDSNLVTAQNIFNIYYRITSISIFFATIFFIIIAKEFKGGKMYKPWIYIASGMMLNIGAGIVLALNVTNYKSAIHPYVFMVDSVWLLSYAVVSYGFLTLAYAIEDIKNNIAIKMKVYRLLKKHK